MRTARNRLGALALVVLAAEVALAAGPPAPVTVSGDLQCAKCTLKEADAKACQDVLVVAAGNGSPEARYYLVKNSVAEKFGHVCQGTKSVTMTGTVSEKDGRKWITATKIDQKKS
ncbi:MAG: DUF6370 family protein [Thermoanaerobaculia bacterium]